MARVANPEVGGRSVMGDGVEGVGKRKSKVEGHVAVSRRVWLADAEGGDVRPVGRKVWIAVYT